MGPTSDAPRRDLRPLLVSGAAAVIILAGLNAAASVVSLVLLSILATILLAPLQARLRDRGSPGWVALAVSLATYIGALAIAGLLVAVGLVGFLRDLPSYEAGLDSALEDLMAAAGGAGTSPPIDGAAVGVALRGIADDILGALATVGYSVFIVAYLLLEAPRVEARLGWAFGPSSEVVPRGRVLAGRLRTYVIARAVLGAVAALLDTLLLVVLGIPAALLWGVLSFLLSFIPNVGFVLALIPPTVLALLQGGPLLGLAVVVGYSVINVAIDYVVQPRFIGGTVDLSPVVVTVCLLFWAVVLGGAGALLAVPATIIVAAALDAFDASRPFARLLVDRLGPTESDG